MSWQESARDVHGGITYVTYRCGWCRKYAVATSGTRLSKCCCNPGGKK